MCLEYPEGYAFADDHPEGQSRHANRRNPAVRKPPVVSTMQLLLPTVMTSPGEARRACRAFARRNHVEAVDTLLLVLSELVTNAVQHGGAPIGIRIECDGGSVRIEVSDAKGNPGDVTPRRDISLDGTGGMGLR